MDDIPRDERFRSCFLSPGAQHQQLVHLNTLPWKLGDHHVNSGRNSSQHHLADAETRSQGPDPCPYPQNMHTRITDKATAALTRTESHQGQPVPRVAKYQGRISFYD